MSPYYSPRDLHEQYQARVNAALRTRNRVTSVRLEARVAGWVRAQVSRIAPWLRGAPRPRQANRSA